MNICAAITITLFGLVTMASWYIRDVATYVPYAWVISTIILVWAYIAEKANNYDDADFDYLDEEEGDRQ